MNLPKSTKRSYHRNIRRPEIPGGLGGLAVVDAVHDWGPVKVDEPTEVELIANTTVLDLSRARIVVIVQNTGEIEGELIPTCRVDSARRHELPSSWVPWVRSDWQE